MLSATDREMAEAGKRLARALGLIVVIVIIGIIGYRLVGGPDSDILSAVYMTMITLTTVGYGEVVDLTHSPGGRVFTIVLLFIGAGSFVYFFSNLTAFIVEGNFDRYLWIRRMKKSIADLENHLIVCGGGATGVNIVRELIATGRPFVLVEFDDERVAELYAEFEDEFPAVVGDATDDDVLIAAGIERAEGLISAVKADRDNLIITVSAKMIRPSIRVVARAISLKMVKKVRQAGAASVISPNVIGGMRMVSEMIRPAAVSFLDIMLRDKDKNLRIEDLPITRESALAETTLGHLRGRRLSDLLVVAVRNADDSWRFNPPDDFVLEPGMSLVYMGSPSARAELERLDS